MLRLVAVALVLTLLAGSAWLLTPDPLVNDVPAPVLPADLDRYISERERAAAAQGPLIPRTEKRLVWQHEGKQTRYAVVYVPGFSATRQEIAPTCELVANALGANLFESRLAGHGYSSNALANVRAEDWLADVAEALAIGARLGERVIVIGTSTGATLALAMAGHPLMRPVEALILISPNFAPADRNARWLTRPGGPLIARYLIGDTRSWEPHNQAQARYWTTSYPTAALVEMMRLVDFARAALPLTLDASVLMLLSPNDAVISADSALRAFARIDAPVKSLIEMSQVGDPSQHVLAGHILSPETTGTVVQHIVEFVQSIEHDN